ncbi:MAG TPA: hypothetical protein VMW49_08655, partial [Candidatus Dormibacteraeota bacterium]|nr:hypothetical protein [Candidatus Dormibacteraeota bacterium]
MQRWWAATRIAFGLVLLTDAILEWQPPVYRVFLPLAYGVAGASPPGLQGALLAADHLLGRNPVAANATLAALETLLALAIIAGYGAAAALLIAVPLFVAIWVVGQGLGLPFVPGTTDVNSGLLYVLLALALWRARSWERLSAWAWVRGAGGPPRR